MATSQCRVVPAKIGHAKFIARNLRQSDLIELEAGGQSRSAVVFSFAQSNYCRAMLAPDGNPFVIWGVGGVPERKDLGCVWMLATEAFEKHAFSFLRVARKELAAMFRLYPVLANRVYSKHESALKWVRALGFRVSDRCDEQGFRLFCKAVQ